MMMDSMLGCRSLHKGYLWPWRWDAYGLGEVMPVALVLDGLAAFMMGWRGLQLGVAMVSMMG
ncbi:MAG: hypothetical protein U0176_18835 [Bacteroidia bacterium]